MKYENILDLMENILSEPDFSQDFAINKDYETIKTCLKNNPSVASAQTPEDQLELMPLRTREETEEDQPSDSWRTKEKTEADDRLVPLRTQDSSSSLRNEDKEMNDLEIENDPAPDPELH